MVNLENIDEKKNKLIDISAGLLIRYNKKILLVHGAKNQWWEGFSPPKGGVDGNESLLDAAIRETEEEVGIRINKSMIDRKDVLVNIYNKKTKTIRKRVFLYLVDVADLNDIGMTKLSLDMTELPRPHEIDFAKFCNKYEFLRLASQHYHIPSILSLF